MLVRWRSHDCEDNLAQPYELEGGRRHWRWRWQAVLNLRTTHAQ
jgi:hypothetical protein